jgi:hypothetical protein
MGARTEKQVKEKRRQKAEAVVRGRNLSPNYKKEKTLIAFAPAHML